MADYLIGVDIGTQGTKTVLFTQSGQVIETAFCASKLIQPTSGRVYEEPDDLYASVILTIHEVMSKSAINPSAVAAIGIDGQMAGIMGIDESWNAVTPYDSWLDTKCEPYISLMRQEAGEKILMTSGCPVTYDHGPKILWWKHEQPETYKRISKFIQPSAYVAGRMAGLKAENAFIDYTYLHFSGFGDIQNLTWSHDLLNTFMVSPEKMPRIVKPWDIIGYLTVECANACSLIASIPLVAGCGDQAATSLGAGITHVGQVFDVAGSASVFSCCVDEFVPDTQHQTLLYPRSVIEGLWQPMAYINGGGLCLRWLKNLVGAVDYDQLNLEAETIAAGCDGLMFIPHFSGRVCPNQPDLRGAYIGLALSQEKGILYRAIMESIACEYAIFLEALTTNLPDFSAKSVHVIGGGSRSSVFNQIKADVLQLPYMALQTGDTAPLGVALTAGYGIGLINSLEQLPANHNMVIRTWQPDPQKKGVYGKLLEQYKMMLICMNQLYKEMRI